MIQEGVMKSIAAVLAVKNSGEWIMSKSLYLFLNLEVAPILTVDLIIKIHLGDNSKHSSKKFSI